MPPHTLLKKEGHIAFHMSVGICWSPPTCALITGDCQTQAYRFQYEDNPDCSTNQGSRPFLTLLCFTNTAYFV